MFFGIITGGTAALWVFPSAAFADSNCSTFHANTEAQPTEQHHGTRVAAPGMHVYDQTPAVACQHISSVTSFDPGLDEFVEVGWDDELNGFTYQHSYCTHKGDGHPILFRAWQVGGNFYCDNFGDLAAPQDTEFAVMDQNVDMHWAFTAQGNYLRSTVPTDFSLSHSLTNGERWGDFESAHAKFNGLQYMPPHGAWTPWGAAHCYSNYDPDPTYFNQIQSATWVNVSTSPQVC
jgi:hypothetical protein